MARDRRDPTAPGEQEPEPDAPSRVSRHVQPVGPRVLVRLIRADDRTDTGLYLPQGTKESHAEALLGEVVEVARTLPKAGAVADDDDAADDDGAQADLGTNVSGIPLGAKVLFSKERGVTVPWDESLRLVDVRHILAIVDVISADEIQ